jgi:hypothetical protein
MKIEDEREKKKKKKVNDAKPERLWSPTPHSDVGAAMKIQTPPQKLTFGYWMMPHTLFNKHIHSHACLCKHVRIWTTLVINFLILNNILFLLKCYIVLDPTWKSQKIHRKKTKELMNVSLRKNKFNGNTIILLCYGKGKSK